MPKEITIEEEGVVQQALSNARFKIILKNKHEIIARIGGKMSKNFIKILPGDRVKVTMTPYDPTKGIITYRYR